MGRGLADGPDLGVGVGRGVAVADAVAVGLAVGVGVAVAVAVGVGLGGLPSRKPMIWKTWSGHTWSGMQAFLRFQLVQPVP